MTIVAYFSALLSLDGELGRKRYGSLLAPVAFFFGGLNFLGFLIGIFATWEIGGWVVLLAMAGGTLMQHDERQGLSSAVVGDFVREGLSWPKSAIEFARVGGRAMLSECPK